MLRLAQGFFDICRLRSGPQHLPTSQFLATLSLAAYLLVGVLVALTRDSLGVSVLSALVDTALLIALVSTALLLTRHPERTRQTVTALAGTGALLGLLSLPLLLLYYATDDGLGGLFSTLIMLLVIWNIAVIGHIVRHALAVPMLAGIAIALLYMILSFQVMNLLFTAPTETF